MSWSISFMGTKTRVVEALKAQSEKLTDASKTEYDAALPHLVGLVEQQIDAQEPVVKIEASGHGYVQDGTIKNNTVRVTLERLYALLV